MAAPVLRGDDRPSRWGYIAAIAVSAGAHAALAVLLLVILPQLWQSHAAPPPAYTVKIVDSLPAGDLGTRLPALHREARRHEESRATPPPSAAATPAPQAEPTPPPENDKNAIALNTLHKESPSPTPTPPPPPSPTPPPPSPVPTARPTVHVTPRPTVRATPRPTPRVRRPTPTPKPRPTPRPVEHRRPQATPTPELARVKPTPSVSQRLAAVRKQLLAEHLEQLKRDEARNAAAASEHPGSGPVLASKETAGKGYGIGPGSGSAGIQQDPEFLLYYKAVQDKIKSAWSFSGDNRGQTATVTFGINPDGTLTGIKVADSSRDPAYDDSVIRAIRAAAPFAPPPAKYRSQFAEGIDAVFKLSELKS